MLAHVPKNPYCDICLKRLRCLSRPLELLADQPELRLRSSGTISLGIDDEKSALVVKDIATGFMYVYPNARRTTNAAILEIKHFVGHNEEIGVFYSDNAPELISAMEILQCRHRRSPCQSASSRLESLALASCCSSLVFHAECSCDGGGGQQIALGT